MRLPRLRWTIRLMMFLILMVALLLVGKIWANRMAKRGAVLSTDREETCGTRAGIPSFHSHAGTVPGRREVARSVVQSDGPKNTVNPIRGLVTRIAESATGHAGSTGPGRTSGRSQRP